MEFILFALFVVSIIYCCDMPVIKGAEVFVNIMILCYMV